jgi:hypothetical protein
MTESRRGATQAFPAGSPLGEALAIGQSPVHGQTCLLAFQLAFLDPAVFGLPSIGASAKMSFLDKRA